MSATLRDVVLGARARVVPLPAETAGYLVLSLGEKAVHAPRRLELDAIELDAEGGVQLLAGEPLPPAAVEPLLRSVLGQLLAVSSAPGPSLLRAARREPNGELGAFLAELERALVPVNRTAGRRALVRLCRETERARRDGSLDVPDVQPPSPPPVPLAVSEPVTGPAIEPETERPAEVLVSAPPPVAPKPAIAESPLEEPSTRPETVVALSESGRPPARESGSERTPYIGSLGLELRMSAPVVIEPLPSPDQPTVELPTRAPPPYAGPPSTPRGVDELVESSFEAAEGLSEESLRAELKRVAGIEATPGLGGVASGPRRPT